MAQISRCSGRDSLTHQLESPAGHLQSSSRSAQHNLEMMDQGIEEDSASLSGSARNSTGPDEAVFDPPTRTSSPQTSNASDDEVSILEDCYTPSHRVSGHFTPLKQRSPFRNPSSVRAMQLDTTPPHLTGSPSQAGRNKIYSHSRQTSTPRSARSHRGTPSRIMNSSPTKSVRKEHPLVLLHVTLLPLAYQYPTSVLESVLPPTILANWELLKEKTTTTVLHRGILVPHPREDYELLEERLLESLELKQPRILKCGHFHLSPEEVADIETYGADESEPDDEPNSTNVVDNCPDCGRRIRNGDFGDAGSGSKRWDVKVFAANGLMRAGAWAAAWREMERVDVEILPWMEESMRRELEARHEEEEQIRRDEEAERREEGVAGLDDERLKEIYGQETQSFIDGLENDVYLHDPKRTTNNRPDQSPSPTFQDGDYRHEEVPLSDLIRNCIYVLAQDRRNLIILLLSLFVLFLSTRSNLPASAVAPPSYEIVADPVTPVIVSSAVDRMKNALPSKVAAESSVASSAKPSQEPEDSVASSAKPSQEPEASVAYSAKPSQEPEASVISAAKPLQEPEASVISPPELSHEEDAIKKDITESVSSEEIVSDAAAEHFENVIHGLPVEEIRQVETV